MSQALILIDIQKDYFPKGNMEVVNSEAATKKAKSLLDAYRNNNFPVIHVQHISTREGATFFLPDTKGAEIHKSVQPLNGEKIITKHFPNSFRGTELEEFLQAQGIKEITFCGMMSHMCIDATVRAAFDKGYSCTVAHDACATRNLSFDGFDVASVDVHVAYMAALSAVYANVFYTSEIIENINT